VAISAATFLGLTTRFLVVIDDINLGGWSRCQGLSVEFHPEFQAEGGNYGYKTILPGRVDYPKVTLERPMNGQDSGRVQGWLRMKANIWAPAANSGGGSTAEITLLDSHYQPVTKWSLRNAYPDSWKGPDLDAMTGGIAMEKLTLVHEGFL
jgi:phage tail-like protein